MNARFGILTYGSTTRVILKESTSSEVLSWLGKGAFEDRLTPEKFAVTDDNGNTSWRPKSRYWLQHYLAAHYGSVVQIQFSPDFSLGLTGLSYGNGARDAKGCESVEDGSAYLNLRYLPIEVAC